MQATIQNEDGVDEHIRIKERSKVQCAEFHDTAYPDSCCQDSSRSHDRFKNAVVGGTVRLVPKWPRRHFSILLI